MFRMLYHYLDHKRKESSARIHATYLVSGKSVDDGQTVRATTNDEDWAAGAGKCVLVLMSCLSSGSPGVCCQRRPAGRCATT